MKAFFFRLSFFLITSFVLANGIALLYAKIAPRKVDWPGGETYEAIKKSHLPSSNHLIVLGDSVCHQLLLVQTPPDTLNLSSNWNISVCGQYMLAHEALKHDANVKEIVLAYQPADYVSSFHGKNTYHYFVRPFYPHPEFRALMSPQVVQELDELPLHRLVVFPMFRYTGMLDSIDYAKTARPTSYKYISPVAIEYLRKFSDLCRERGIRFKVVSTPISSKSDYDQAVFIKEMKDAHLEDILAGFIESIRYVDPAQLKDGIHFKGKYIKPNSDEFLKLLN